VPGACAPQRPNTFAQTILSLSFFACDKAADHTFRLADHSGTTAFVDTSAFELSRWRGGRYRVCSLKRRWSLEEFTVQRYDDVDMSGETSSTSMNINNCLIAQLLFLQ
jgi:hypothetical protein